MQGGESLQGLRPPPDPHGWMREKEREKGRRRREREGVGRREEITRDEGHTKRRGRVVK
jgi:hypothetical protein